MIPREQLRMVAASLGVCAVLLTTGIVGAKLFEGQQQSKLHDTVLDVAVSTGERFAKELDLAVLPLFSIAQFATELEMFADLPDRIGPANNNATTNSLNSSSNSRPLIANTFHRDVGGLCDDPQLVARYNGIAQNIKEHANMGRILHSLQLAPHGVICLVHPLNNTEDFDDPADYLDNTSIIGLDLLNEPRQRYIAERSLQQSDVLGIAGPTQLRQCRQCGWYFIVRMPMVSTKHLINIEGVDYPRWGFATALIHWENLVAQTQILDSLETQRYEFQLARTDRTFNETTQQYDKKVVVLAESKRFGSLDATVSTKLQTTNNEWVMTINYSSEIRYYGLVLALACLLPLCISLLVFMVLFQKHKHAKSKLQNMAQKAKVDVERNITSYFAHELRNPLGAIDSALMSLEETEDNAELLSSMRLCSEFMSNIMNNLLDVRKMEEGMMVLKRDPVCISKMLEDVRAMNKPNLKPDVELNIQCRTKQHDWVLADLHRLQQVLTNVVTNSIKHTLRGSITLVAEWEGELLRLECRDTGPGIPKQEQGHLFARFATRGGAPGTGLGLAISKCIVELMGGEIYFDSDPTIRPGTNCIVLLSLSRCDEPEQSGKLQTDDRPIQERLNILLVDDMTLSRNLLRRRFEGSIAPNCTVVEARTGEEALALCQKQDFDVVVMDQYMDSAGGVLLGTDTIIAMRRRGNKAYIIGCSGNDLDEMFWSAGANRVWQKPMPSNSAIIEQLRMDLCKPSCKTHSDCSFASNESAPVCTPMHETVEVYL